MDLELAGKTAVVVAASKGIGRGVAAALAAEGCRVVITSSSTENLTAAARALQTRGGVPIDTEVMNLRSADSIARASAAIQSRHAVVDILVTNGPGPAPGPAATLSQTALAEAIQVQLVSVVQLCTTFLPGMLARHFGRVIVLASTTAREPDDDLVLSNVTRAAVVAYAKTLSREVARSGVTVNSILTGGVLTDRTEVLLRREAERSGITYDEALRAASSRIPVGSIATPQQLAAAVVFLSSPLAGYVTGVGLPIDGGLLRSL